MADEGGALDSGTASDETETDLVAYGQAVDVAAHVPTLSGAIVAAGVAGLVWIWRQVRRRRAAGVAPHTQPG